MNRWRAVTLVTLMALSSACGDAADPGERNVFSAVSGGLGRSGRWFTNGGKPVYMVGLDAQSLVAQKPGAMDPAYDGNYTKVLDYLKAARINKVRLWANCWFLDPAKSYQPFKLLPSGKYDLDQWDSTYWSRLRDFVNKAGDRGIFVEYNLFSQYPDAARWTGGANFWSKALNVNGAFADNDGTPGGYLELFVNANGQKSASGHDFNYYQQRLIDKAVAEIGGYGNVFFKVLNEPRDDKYGAQIFPWTRSTASYLHNTKGMLASVDSQAGGDMSVLKQYSTRSYVDIIGSNSYTDAPNTISIRLHPYQLSNKVLQCSESFDHRVYLARTTREAWGWATSGGHYAFFGRGKDYHLIGDATWNKTAKVTRTLRDTMESVSFWKMSPVDASGKELDGLVHQGPGSGWQVLAAPGSDYLVYFWGARSTTGARIDLPAGSYDYRWIDVRDGDLLRSGTVSGQQAAVVQAPSTSGWSGDFGLALVVQRKTTTSPPPPADAGAPPPPADSGATPPPGGATITLPAAADTFVIVGSGSSFGGNSLISVSAQPRYGYLRFDLRQLSGAIASARLRLHVAGASSGTNQQRVQRVAADGWSEATMTYATRPAAGAVEVAAFTPVPGSWTDLDVTTAAVSEQGGDGVLSLQLGALQGYAGYVSKEGAAQQRPQLVVTLKPSTPPTPPPTTPKQATLPAAADTFVIVGSSSSFGGNSLISVSAQPRHGYLRFDLRQLSGAIASARLQLRVAGASSGANQLRVQRVAADGWSEATMTWATRPAAGAVEVAAFTPVPDSWTDLDVTAAAVSEQGGDGVLSLQLGALQGYAGFVSREGAAQHSPRLVVTTQ